VRVLVCPDKFAGTLTAAQAAQAIADGWRSVAPDDEVTVRPLADGGPGFLDVLGASLDAHVLPVPTVDPLGRSVPGSVLIAGERAYLESAQACGLALLSQAERAPLATTSYGLGILLAAAAETGVREVVIGLGGSATNDAGAGMLAALGAAPLDEAGYALPYGGAALIGCSALGGQPRLRSVRLVAATDVTNPLCGPQGASAVFGPQKGASERDVQILDAALARFAGVLERSLPTCPPTVADLPGAGAAGGLGAAILACGGRCEPGFDVVRAATGLDESMDQCDLVITGEGSVDRQSLWGKVVGRVAGLARERDRACVVLAGRIEQPIEGVLSAHSLVDYFGSEESAMARPAQGLADLAARVARGFQE
jgi:glycerate 2-kinase